MRSVFHQAAPGIALDKFKTMQDLVEQNTFSQRLGLYLVGSFAGLAVLMVIAGLYGVLSQFVGYRRREIGVRMALGASRQSVAKMVLRQGSILIAVGLGVGIALSISGGAVDQELSLPGPGIGRLDLRARSCVALPAVGLIAAFLPAARRHRFSPCRRCGKIERGTSLVAIGFYYLRALTPRSRCN